MADNCCDDIEEVEPTGDCVESLVYYKKSWANCWGLPVLIINLFCALKDIAAAIREAAGTPSGRQDGVLHFNVDEWEEIEHDACLDVPILVSPFDHEVTGIGVSYISPALADANGGPSFQTDDKFIVKLWDYTDDAIIGSPMELTTAVKIASQHDAGAVIGVIPLGHTVGVKLCLDADAGDSVEAFPFDLLIYVKPNELNPA